MSKYEVKIETLLDLKLSFEEYFVLYCLQKKNKDLLISYIETCNKIDTTVYYTLRDKGYISLEIGDDEGIYFSKISLTEDGEKLFGVSHMSVGTSFDQFKNNYPSKVKGNGKVRRLHGNLNKCRKLYSDIIKSGVTYETLCKCARLYNKELENSGDVIYTQMLETWLRQRTFEQYVDEVEEEEEEGGFTYDI